MRDYKIGILGYFIFSSLRRQRRKYVSTSSAQKTRREHGERLCFCNAGSAQDFKERIKKGLALNYTITYPMDRRARVSFFVFSQSTFNPRIFKNMKLFFPHQISITGASASGTSSTMNALKPLLPHNLYRFVSMGALFRLRGSQSGFDTIEDFVKHRLENPELDIDRQIDEMGNTLGLMDYSVLESRLGYVLWPGAFQVRLVCPLDIRAERRAKQLGVSVWEAKRLILQRDKDDTCLYQGLYGPGIIWPDNRFNQVIDTSLLTPEQSAKEIVLQHAAWKDDLGQDAFLKSPLCCQLGVNFEELWQQ